MSKIFPYRIVKKSQLTDYKKISLARENEITSATEFVKEIEKGNLEAQYSNQESESSVLASSLISMRNKMKEIAREEKERNWVTEGMARFVEILRANDNGINELADHIIRELVKYLGANQGALYILNDMDSNDVFIERIASYAYDRKKFLNQRINIGEGLTGQALLEKDTIYLTEIPQDYIKITSGLGEAPPCNLIIVPLKIEDRVYGAVEIAAFEKFKKYQILFIEKLSESIASTISNVKTNERTKKLLEETQIQAEQMRSQEEEMRQNMEELSSTQEEIERILKATQEKEKYQDNLINVSTDRIFTIDKNYRIISFNKAFADILGMIGTKVEKGFDMLALYPTEAERDRILKLYNRALAGESIEVTDQYDDPSYGTMYVELKYQPMRNDHNEVYAIACFSRDITERTKADILVKQQTEELRAQEEEMRQNLEELNATQEEMQRLLKNAQESEQYITEVLNSTKDSIFIIDHNYGLISWNKSFSAGLEAMGLKITKGFDVLSIFSFSEDKKLENKLQYDRALKGEVFEETNSFNMEGVESYYTSSYSPLKKEDGSVFAVAVFAKDVTELAKAKNEASRLEQGHKKALAEEREKFKKLEAEYKSKIAELEAKAKR